MASPLAPYMPRYGKDHPEFVQNPIWELAIRNNWTGYQLQQHFELERPRAEVCRNPSFSVYRDDEAGPFWSWERFGRSSTSLPDGRVIHIAGEHEDSYDSDFCIYNDVVVEYPTGQLEIYLYPKDVFPPTDFHTATLVGDDILIIGSLGYRDMRRIGETQVMMFNTKTLRFSNVPTSGDVPGWICMQTAEKLGGKILIAGGKVETGESYTDNKQLFELDLATMTWVRREHGDVDIFPVTSQEYIRFKSPAYGQSNPERVINPFWLEMAKRHWPPSRVRLHFGDFAPPKSETEIGPLPPMPSPLPEPGTRAFEDWLSAINIDLPKLTRARDDVVWTSARQDPARITLSDGRKLIIGGHIDDYGDEYADPWIYNDIVVTNVSGEVEVYAYPLQLFPHFWSLVAVTYADSIYVFGRMSGDYHPEDAGRFIALKVEPKSFTIVRLPVAALSGIRLNIYPGCAVQRGTSVIFPNIRMTNNDPELGVALDLETCTWSEPFPHEAPPSTEED